MGLGVSFGRLQYSRVGSCRVKLTECECPTLHMYLETRPIDFDLGRHCSTI